MAFYWNQMVYTNNHELNLDWFNEHFKEIFEEWADLYDGMLSWKEDTDEEIQTLLNRSEQLLDVYQTWVDTTQQNTTDISNLRLAAIQLSNRIDAVNSGKLDKPTNSGSAGMTIVLQNDNTTKWGPIAIDPDTIQNAVDDWLEDNPFEVDYLGYVTPEMYGAAGDGTTDDTTAIQNAVNSGLPVRLMSNYKCGKITGTNIRLIGDGYTIINKDNDILFEASATFYGENFVINNPQTFDYLSTDTVYGTIKGVNVYCKNVTFNNINSAGVYASGDCNIDTCIFNNTNFNVKTIYDGSADNHSFGVYLYQTSVTKMYKITNCEFISLIEGVYIGTSANDTATCEIDNNYFNTIGDHAVYLNSSGDRIHALISNNMLYKVATSFAISGNSHIIRDNFVNQAYDGDRVTFGFSIREGNNIMFENNIYISGTFTTSAGMGANCLVYANSSGLGKNIVFENNYFEFTDSGTTIPWLRIGATGYDLSDITFRNNCMIIKGGAGITRQSDFEFYLLGNKIYFDQNLLTLATAKAIVKDNYIENLENTGIFQIASYGEYKNNVFNTKAIPLRRASDVLFDVEGNINKYNIGVYNLLANIGTDNIKFKCFKRGRFTSPASGHAQITDIDDIRPAFHNTIFVFDDIGNPVSFTITSQNIAYIYLDIAAGTYNYILM